jgi:hypothetical protein
MSNKDYIYFPYKYNTVVTTNIISNYFKKNKTINRFYFYNNLYEMCVT